MSGTSQWQASEQLAWTEHDGPTRPPRGVHPLLNLTLAGVLAAVFAGMVFTDTLCPEHRALVQVLGTIALVGCVASAIALARGWAAAPAITAGTAVIGVGIGYIDATHDSTRGSIIVVCFAVALVGAAWLLLQQLGLRLWEKDEKRRAALSPSLALPSDLVVGSGAAAASTFVDVEAITSSATPAEGHRVEAR